MLFRSVDGVGDVGPAPQAWSELGGGEAEAPKVDLTEIKTSSGKTTQVAKQYASQFQGFINDLEKLGYKINVIGGYANRMNVNDPTQLSKHAYGAAIDINPEQNPNKSTTTDLPKETATLAAKWGLGWGMNWTSVKDPMHFSADPSEGGSRPQATIKNTEKSTAPDAKKTASDGATMVETPKSPPPAPPTQTSSATPAAAAPSKGQMVAAASTNYSIASRVPPAVGSSIAGGRGEAAGVARSHRPSESYITDTSDPGNVEPLDTRQRYFELGIAA